jgi:hypothetical protein
LVAKPSISVSSWLRVCESLPRPMRRVPPSASISSMNRMEGAASRARLNSLRIRDAPARPATAPSSARARAFPTNQLAQPATRNTRASCCWCGASARTHTDIHVVERRRRRAEKRHGGGARHGSCQERLARARRAHQQNTLGRARSQRRVTVPAVVMLVQAYERRHHRSTNQRDAPRGVLEEVNDLLQLRLRLVATSDVVQRGFRHLAALRLFEVVLRTLPTLRATPHQKRPVGFSAKPVKTGRPHDGEYEAGRVDGERTRPSSTEGIETKKCKEPAARSW